MTQRGVQRTAEHDDWLGHFRKIAEPRFKQLFPLPGASLPESLAEKLRRLEKTETDAKRRADE